ncbi:hypothetical protein DFH27DRAFT_39093 [Peziza echinospora]|nr:hypothetical protein DFH27DRAFT_39093 [Peziza echinospora]
MPNADGGASMLHAAVRRGKIRPSAASLQLDFLFGQFSLLIFLSLVPTFLSAISSPHLRSISSPTLCHKAALTSTYFKFISYHKPLSSRSEEIPTRRSSSFRDSKRSVQRARENPSFSGTGKEPRLPFRGVACCCHPHRYSGTAPARYPALSR